MLENKSVFSIKKEIEKYHAAEKNMRALEILSASKFAKLKSDKLEYGDVYSDCAQCKS